MVEVVKQNIDTLFEDDVGDAVTNSKGSLARPTTYWSPLGLVQQKP